MAIFIPNNENNEDFHSSFGEYELYKRFKKLSNDYYIFHSVEWIDNKKNSDSKTQGEADYVIFNPKRGILIIEVKGGEIRFEGRQIYQKNILNKKEKNIIDPMNQANRSKYKFIDMLSKNGLIDKYKVESAVWFTGIKNYSKLKNLPMNYDFGNVLTKEDYKDIESSINRVFDFYNMKQIIDYYAIKKVLNLFSPEFHAIPTLMEKFSEEKYMFEKMTNEQIRILDILEDEKYASIKGGAGTGKTTVAVEKARRISKNGDKTLFLVYNKFLAETLRENYKDTLPNVDFYSLYSFGYELKGKYLGDNADEEYIEILKDNNINFKYKHIIIDEGQDFNFDYLNEFYEIASNL